MKARSVVFLCEEWGNEYLMLYKGSERVTEILRYKCGWYRRILEGVSEWERKQIE